VLLLATACSDTADPGGPADAGAPLDDAGEEADAGPPPDADAAGPADIVPPEPNPSEVPAGTLTVAGLPAAWNGSVPLPGLDGGPERPFSYRVPTAGTTIDLLQAPEDPELDLSAATLACGGPGHARWSPVEPPETPGVPDAVPAGAPEGPVVALRWWVSEAAPLPEGQVDCSLEAPSADGRWLHRAGYQLEAGQRTADLDPFEEEETWLLVFSRDLFTITVVGDGETLEAREEANGLPDFEEALTVMGVLGGDPAFNEELLTRWRAAFLTSLRGIFGIGPDGERGPDGVRVRLVLEGDPGAPDPADFSPDGGFSLMAIGGDGAPDDITDGNVGRAAVDWNNRRRDDDSLPGRGVFVTQVFRKAAEFPAVGPTLAQFLPGIGTPLGDDPGDLELLETGSGGGTRGLLIELVVDVLSLGVAAICAHEMGHSLGLVPSGLPPEGLFSEVQEVPFSVKQTTGLHVDTPGLNVMQTGRDFQLTGFFSGLPAFSYANRAYLLRRILVGPPSP